MSKKQVGSRDKVSEFPYLHLLRTMLLFLVVINRNYPLSVNSRYETRAQEQGAKIVSTSNLKHKLHAALIINQVLMYRVF